MPNVITEAGIPQLTTTGVWHRPVKVGTRHFVIRWLMPKTRAVASLWAAKAWVYEATRGGDPKGEPLFVGKTYQDAFEYLTNLA